MPASRVFLAFTVLALSATSASASILAPGTDVAAVADGTVTGPVITSGTGSFLGLPTGTIAGTYSFSAIQESLAANPLGGLTFVYTVNSSTLSTHSIERITVSDFAGFTTNVAFTGPGVGPADINRTLDGDVIGFNFSPAGGLAPNNASAQLIVRTDSLGAAPNFLSIIDNNTATVVATGPVPGGGRAPEPSSLGLLGLGALALVRRRR